MHFPMATMALSVMVASSARQGFESISSAAITLVQVGRLETYTALYHLTGQTLPQCQYLLNLPAVVLVQQYSPVN